MYLLSSCRRKAARARYCKTFTAFTVLSIILTNVLITPWGLASHATALAIVLAAVLVAIKLSALGIILVSIEAGFGKLRLMRNVDFLVAATVLAAVGGLAAALGI